MTIFCTGFLNREREIGLVPGVLAWLGVLLVPVLGSDDNIVLETDGDIRNLKGFVAADFFEFDLRAADLL